MYPVRVRHGPSEHPALPLKAAHLLPFTEANRNNTSSTLDLSTLAWSQQVSTLPARAVAPPAGQRPSAGPDPADGSERPRVFELQVAEGRWPRPLQLRQ
jgi:hypothetical protein